MYNGWYMQPDQNQPGPFGPQPQSPTTSAAGPMPSSDLNSTVPTPGPAAPPVNGYNPLAAVGSPAPAAPVQPSMDGGTGFGQPVNSGLPPIPPVPAHDHHKTWLIVGVTFIGLTVLVGGFATWLLLTYMDLKGNYDAKVETEKVAIEKEQADLYAQKLEEDKKDPNREFAGPDDFGRLSFKYPKTWSVYIENEGSTSGKDYEAYLHPYSVPPVSDTQRFAVRVLIEQKDYDKKISEFSALVKRGDLQTSSVTINGTQGTRLQGSFTKDIRGTAVIFKIRDKVVTLRSDADTFKQDFEKLISSITFNA